jgi:hypothetical protein
VVIAAELHQLGQETLAKVDQLAPLDARHGMPGTDEIPALGACTRPTERDRAVMRAIVTRGIAADDLYDVAFGCMDARGTIVTLAYDIVTSKGRTGAYDVLLVAGGKATKIDSLRALSRMDYMEWADERSLGVSLLVDLDGDGVHDALLGRGIHEGGAIHSNEELSLWSSRSGHISQLGTYDDAVRFARGQLAAPIVLVLERQNAPVRYRCLEANGTVDLCPAIDDARKIDRIAEVATGFVNGTVPDRDLLAEELDLIGVEPNRRARLLQGATETLRSIRMQRAIATFVEPKLVREHGEIVDHQPADPRGGQLAALGGDAPCTMTATDQHALAPAVTRWIETRDHRKDRKELSIVATCGDRTRGYIAVHWSYDEPQKGELHARDGVFAIDKGGLVPLVDASLTGPDFVCAACDGTIPGVFVGSSFFRHGKELVAITIDRSTEKGVLAIAIDGKSAKVPSGAFEWARLREPELELYTVVQTSDPNGTTYWHWDGTLQPIATIAWAAIERPRDATGLAARIWDETIRGFAIVSLGAYDPARWAGDAAVRTETRKLLQAAGADAATLAKIDAI